MKVQFRCTNSFLAAALTLVSVWFIASPTLAEDAIERIGSTTPVRGTITEVSRTEVILKARTTLREHRVPVNEIERIRWDAEKPQLSQLRNDERNGKFDKAIEGYEAELKEAPASADNLRTDLEFLIARTRANKALAAGKDLDDSIKRLDAFRTAHPNSYRYFEALRLLARLAMEKPDVEKAGATLKLMAEAPWNDYKMEADILQARVALAHDDLATALKSLENVIAVPAKTSAELSRRYEALLTKAECLQKQAKFEEATKVFANILDEASDDDKKTLAETCVRLGDCYQAAGRTKEAILAYLRVDLLFPKEKSQHAEALYHLSRLFAQDGKPDKAAEAQAKLQESYPRSPWTAKLSVAPK